MNYFLLLIIIGLGVGGYFEYTSLQQKAAADQQQLADLGAKVDTLQSDKDKLTKSETDNQAEIADLTKQVQDAKSALAAAKTQAAQAATSNTSLDTTTSSTSTTPAAAPVSNHLGTIVTLDGKTYQNCQLLNVKAEGIIVNDSDGIMEIAYGLLPLDLQKRFGYDPKQAAALTEAQVEYQEEQRKAASQATGN
jgi:hypothetical protein